MFTALLVYITIAKGTLTDVYDFSHETLCGQVQHLFDVNIGQNAINITFGITVYTILNPFTQAADLSTTTTSNPSALMCGVLPILIVAASWSTWT